jgi:hypothetical protein
LIVDEGRSQDLHEEDSYMYQSSPIKQAAARSRELNLRPTSGD